MKRGRRAHFGALFTSALYAQLEEKRGSWRSTLAVNLLPWMLSKAAEISSCWIYFTDCRANNTLLSTSCLNWCVPKVCNKGSALKPSGEKPVSLSAGFCFDITSLLLSSQRCIVPRSRSHAGAGVPLTGCCTLICKNYMHRSLDF